MAKEKYLSAKDLERLRRFNQQSLFYALSHVRSRRIGLGYEVDTGRKEKTPYGWEIEYPEGALPFKSEKKPEPLTDLENALLCWAACGTTGWVTADTPHGCGTSTFLYWRGRTCPSPCNDNEPNLIYITDEGVFFYRSPDPETVYEIETEEDWEKIMKWYKECSTKLMDGRPDIPGRFCPMMMWNINANKPGSTLFVPVYDLMPEYINLLWHWFEYERAPIVDDETGGFADATGIMTELVEKEVLVNFPVSIEFFEVLLAKTVMGVTTGTTVQNLRLTAELMGLGHWTFGGFSELHVMGMYPPGGADPLTPCKGLEFRAYERPTVVGIPIPVEIPRVWKSATTPPFETVKEAYDHVKRLKYGRNVLFDKEAPAPSGWKPEVSRKVMEHEKSYTPEWAEKCALSYLTYCIEKKGRFPVRPFTLPLSTPMIVQIHHLDTDFYDKYYKSGYITTLIRDHWKNWHE